LAVTGTMEIGEGNEHLEVIHISLQISRQNEQNLKSTNIRSIIILIQIQNMNIKLNMKDINKILALAHFKCKFFFFNTAKKAHFCEIMFL
jgi:hypothetical protein